MSFVIINLIVFVVGYFLWFFKYFFYVELIKLKQVSFELKCNWLKFVRDFSDEFYFVKYCFLKFFLNFKLYFLMLSVNFF